MIPKVIHYCWFGKAPLPPLADKCIASWRRYMPDYEILRWDESNFDVEAVPYIADAYAAGKYAFVSDYARFLVLYRQGGVYFDTDVELIAPIDDILADGPFMGFEICGKGKRMAVAPGLGLAAEPGMPLYAEILERYETLPFLLEDGGINPYSMIPMVTDMLEDEGLKGDGGIERAAGVTVYPPEWFNPFDDATGRLRKTADTRAVHWYAKSWLPPEPKVKTFLKRLARRVLGVETLLKLKHRKG